MAKLDRRTLTNQPDPPDYGKTAPTRIRTQIHRRISTTEPLTEQWDADSGRAPDGLRTPSGKMTRKPPEKP